MKATRNLATATQFRGVGPPYELQAIKHLLTLITGNIVASPNQSIETVEQAYNISIADTPHQYQEPDPDPSPQPISINIPVNDCDLSDFATNFTPAANDGHWPALLSKEEDDYKLVRPHYNLRPCPSLVSARINPTIITGINIEIPERKYAHGLTAANHALQILQLQ